MAQFGGLNLSGGLAGFSLTEERGDGVNRRSGPERTVEIPVIDDAQLNEMMARMRPIQKYVREGSSLTHFEPGLHKDRPTELHYVNTANMDPRLRKFTYGTTPAKIADNVQEIFRISTYHTMDTNIGASMAEVLAQIPESLQASTIGYETIDPGFNKKPIVHSGLNSFAVMETVLYGRKEAA